MLLPGVQRRREKRKRKKRKKEIANGFKGKRKKKDKIRHKTGRRFGEEEYPRSSLGLV